jgi:hypothetical protein
MQNQPASTPTSGHAHRSNQGGSGGPGGSARRRLGRPRVRPRWGIGRGGRGELGGGLTSGGERKGGRQSGGQRRRRLGHQQVRRRHSGSARAAALGRARGSALPLYGSEWPSLPWRAHVGEVATPWPCRPWPIRPDGLGRAGWPQGRGAERVQAERAHGLGPNP